jgi:hypothetical protein
LEYEFKDIEDAVRKAIGQIRSSNKKMGSLGKIRDTVEKQIDRAKTSFTLRILDQPAEGHISRIVQYHQFAFAAFLDEVSLTIQTKRGNTIPEVIALQGCLDSLLEYLRDHYRAHFNLNFPAPLHWTDATLAQLKECTETVEAILVKLSDKDLAAIYRNMIAGLQMSNEDPSYQRIAFITEVCNQVKSLVATPTDEQLREFLLSVNYNEREYVTYYVQFLRKTLGQAETQADKIEHIAFQLKTISQIHALGRLGFNPTGRSIKQQLLDWLVDELEFYERKQRHVVNGIPKGDEAVKDFKLLFDLSVAQLALLIKTLVDTSVIQNKNLSEVLRFFAMSSTTKRSENVSFESLRIKYYNTEDTTKQMLRVLLTNCAKYVSSSS